MSVVNIEAGMVTEAEVRASVRRVIEHAESIWDEWAWQVEHRTWTVLGYDSWDEMRRGEYGALTSVSAPRAERPELVARFRGAGLTQRQTADTLGVTEQTIYNHERKERDPNYLGRPVPCESDEIVDAEIVEDEPSTARPQPTTPISGALRAVPRRALPDQFFDAVYDAVKKVESLHRLISDDRFPQNAEKVAAKHRNDLLRARDLFEQVINSLPETEFTP